MRGAKVVSLSLSAALLAVGLTACGTGNGNVKTQSVRNNGSKYNVNSLPQNRMFTRNTNGQNSQMNGMRYSAALSNKVAQLKEVQSAHVVVTDRDAYVAITRHNNANRNGVTTRGTGAGSMLNGSRANGPTNLGTNLGTTNVAGPYGADYGTRGMTDNGLAGNMGMTGRTGNNLGAGYTTRGATNGTVNRMNTNSTTDTGTGMGMGMGAGMGMRGQVTDRIPQNLKDSISDTVKKASPHVQNVYVSEDSDFVTEMGNYGLKSRGGEALNTLSSDFQTLIDRIFPGRAGTMTGPNGYAPTTPNHMNTNSYRGGMTTDGYTGGVTR